MTLTLTLTLNLNPNQALKKTKTKTKMTLKESAAYLANSAYIRNLAALVICYGMSINIVEVWARAGARVRG